MFLVDQREILQGATQGPAQWGYLMGVGAAPRRMLEGPLMDVQREEGIIWDHSGYEEHPRGHGSPRVKQETFTEPMGARRGSHPGDENRLQVTHLFSHLPPLPPASLLMAGLWTGVG